MMSKFVRQRLQQRFVEATQSQAFETITDLVEKLDAAGFWDLEFLSRALVEQKKALARKLVRGMKRSNGRPVFQSVAVRAADGQRDERRYKQVSLFEPGDFAQCIQYREAMIRRHARARADLLADAREMYPEEFQFELQLSDAPLARAA